jgi:catechol 2,3-dioxygenase-like lactoylglutathione lyase family enzyme
MKTHLSLSARDLDASVAFYRALLDSEPAKHYDDYALFVTENPGLELALSHNPGTQASANVHFGVAVDAPELVDRAIERLKMAGIEADIETEETCCYAKQNKVWATDPDGHRWETYYVIAESEERNDTNTSCCQNADEKARSCC